MKHKHISWFSQRRIVAAACVVMVFLVGMPDVRATNTSAVGSYNVTVADPAVPRPGTEPCVVELFPRQRFGRKGDNTRMDAKPRAFKYRPPDDCQGPWAKVVLEANFSVDAGRQYDRTASIWLNGVNLYFGTTQEPTPGRDGRPPVAPSWQVQRDLTDYSQLFRSPGTGRIDINNWLGNHRNSPIHASARLLFYPANPDFPAPRVPDAVYALNEADTMPAKLKTGKDSLARAIVFPRNTTRVYLDVLAQPQHDDEFYYACLDDKIIRQVNKNMSTPLRTCGGGSYREVEVSIDGQPAGLAPISPWVFTGGIDHFMWRPVPGVQTLNFLPYRIDLTPFAGLLSDGKAHAVSVRVLHANNYFSVAATLLVYRDPQAEQTGGAVTKNTLQYMSLKPIVFSSLDGQSGFANGDVRTRARQSYVIEGYVNTSHGRVSTRVQDTIGFANTQQFVGDQSGHRHVTEQTARMVHTSHSTGAGSHDRKLRKVVDYSLRVHMRKHPSGDDGRTRATHVRQRFAKHVFRSKDGEPFYRANMHNTVAVSDQIDYPDKDGGISFNHHDQSSVQRFAFSNSLGDCYRAEIQARESHVSHVSKGLGCNGLNTLHWFVRPDGSPASFGWQAPRIDRREAALGH